MPTFLIGRLARYAGGLLLVAALAGCGANGGKATIRGKVRANGQPVVGGSITFMPTDSQTGARPASGEVNPDGTFVLGTDEPADGVAVGKHTVSYSPPSVEQPEWDGYGTQPPTKETPYAGLVPQQVEIEVQGDTSDLVVELVPAAEIPQ